MLKIFSTYNLQIKIHFFDYTSKKCYTLSEYKEMSAINKETKINNLSSEEYVINLQLVKTADRQHRN